MKYPTKAYGYNGLNIIEKGTNQTPFPLILTTAVLSYRSIFYISYLNRKDTDHYQLVSF